jgi:hypothetical protein
VPAEKTALLAGSLDMCGTPLAHVIRCASAGQPVVSWLNRCVWEAISEYLQPASSAAELRPAAVNSIQTFGVFLGYTPHSHMLAAICSHVPNKGEQMVRYYGYYSNVARGKRRKTEVDDVTPCILEPELVDKAFRRKPARGPTRHRCATSPKTSPAIFPPWTTTWSIPSTRWTRIFDSCFPGLRISSPGNRRLPSFAPRFRIDTGRGRPVWFRYLFGRFRPKLHVGLTSWWHTIREIEIRDGCEKRVLITSPSPKNICAAQGSGKKADWCGFKGTNPSKTCRTKDHAERWQCRNCGQKPP